MFLVNWTMRALMGNLIKLCKFDLIATRWRCDDDDNDDYDVKQQDLFCEQRCCSVFILNTLTTPKGTWYILQIFWKEIFAIIEIIAIKDPKFKYSKYFQNKLLDEDFASTFLCYKLNISTNSATLNPAYLYSTDWKDFESSFKLDLHKRPVNWKRVQNQKKFTYLWKSNIWATWKKKKMNIEISKRGRNWVFSNVNHMEFVLCWGGRVLRSVAVSWCVNRLSGNISDTAYL